MRPVLVSEPPIGAGWLHEIKQDGWRMIADLDRARAMPVALWSRNGIDWATRFARIAAAVAALPVQRCVLDGEAVLLRPDGRSDFLGLRGRMEAAELVAFDLLVLETRDLRGEPLEARQAALAELLAVPRDGLRLSRLFEDEGATVYRHACTLGLEGIVSKRRGSRYRGVASDNWRKCRCEGYSRACRCEGYSRA